MKKFLFALMCTVLSFATIAAQGPILTNLKISGHFLKKKNVSYEVCEIHSNMSRTVVEKGKGIFGYSFELELNKNYVITFTKDSLVKTLYVDVTKASKRDLDIDFNSTNCAKLTWDPEKYQYDFRVMNKPASKQTYDITETVNTLEDMKEWLSWDIKTGAINSNIGTLYMINITNCLDRLKKHNSATIVSTGEDEGEELYAIILDDKEYDYVTEQELITFVKTGKIRN